MKLAFWKKPSPCQLGDHAWTEIDPVFKVKPMTADQQVHITGHRLEVCTRCKQERLGKEISINLLAEKAAQEDFGAYWH